MAAPGTRSLWAVSVSTSLLVHLGLAFALASLVTADFEPPQRTRITIVPSDARPDETPTPVAPDTQLEPIEAGLAEGATASAAPPDMQAAPQQYDEATASDDMPTEAAAPDETASVAADIDQATTLAGDEPVASSSEPSAEAAGTAAPAEITSIEAAATEAIAAGAEAEPATETDAPNEVAAASTSEATAAAQTPAGQSSEASGTLAAETDAAPATEAGAAEVTGVPTAPVEPPLPTRPAEDAAATSEAAADIVAESSSGAATAASTVTEQTAATLPSANVAVDTPPLPTAGGSPQPEGQRSTAPPAPSAATAPDRTPDATSAAPSPESSIGAIEQIGATEPVPASVGATIEAPQPLEQQSPTPDLPQAAAAERPVESVTSSQQPTTSGATPAAADAVAAPDAAGGRATDAAATSAEATASTAADAPIGSEVEGAEIPPSDGLQPTEPGLATASDTGGTSEAVTPNPSGAASGASATEVLAGSGSAEASAGSGSGEAVEAIKAGGNGNSAVARPIEAASAVASGTASAGAPSSAEAVAGTAPAGAAVAGSGDASGSAIPVAPTAEQRTAALSPAWPELQNDDSGRRFAALLDYLVGYNGGDCFAVAPELRPGGDMALTAYATDGRTGALLQGRLAEVLGMDVPVVTGTVSEAQCSALSFFRRVPGYPSQTLRIRLDATQVPSGTSLNGRILGDTRNQVHLLIVDDEGTVQSVDPYLKADAGAYTFTFPVFLTSGAVTTVQLLVAVGTPVDLSTITAMNGQPADAYFPALIAEMTERRLPVSIAVRAFGVD